MKKENLNQHTNAYTTTFEFYDENLEILNGYAQFLLERIKIKKPENVLSLGIGYETVSETILNEVKNGIIVKYDIIEGSDILIKQFVANKKIDQLKEVSVIHTYFEEYKPVIKYDLIEMGFVLEHVDEPFFILNTFKEHLKPDGVICIGVPNARSLHRLIGYEAELLKDLYSLSAADLSLGHKRYFDIHKIINLIHECGLNYTNLKGIMLKPITTGQMKTLGFNEKIFNALLKIGADFPSIANSIYIEAVKP